MASVSIAAHAFFGQRERRDRALGETREVFLLLRFVAEHFERLRNADGLMRGEQGGERAIDR
jgi:hypothetical protein